MNITQIYETTVFDRESKIAADFIVVPRKAFRDQGRLPPLEPSDTNDEIEQLNEIARVLGAEVVRVLSPSDVRSAMQFCLEQAWEYRHVRSTAWRGISRSRIEPFAAILADEPVVPFEQSPLSSDSFAAILGKASNAGLATSVGLLMVGHTPLLALVVPAGMIIFGAASGVASGLHEGLRLRVLEWIKRKPARRRLRKAKNVDR